MPGMCKHSFMHNSTPENVNLFSTVSYYKVTSSKDHPYKPLRAGGQVATVDELRPCSLDRGLPVSLVRTASRAASASLRPLAGTRSFVNEPDTSSDDAQPPTSRTHSPLSPSTSNNPIEDSRLHPSQTVVHENNNRNLARWQRSQPLRQLKFLLFKNARWRTAVILKTKIATSA